VTSGERPARGVRHGAAWYLLYIAASRLGTFGLSVIVARLLGPVQAGAFGVALQAIMFASFVGVLNIGLAASQSIAAEPDPARQRRTVGVSFVLVLLGTLFTGGLLALLSPWLAGAVFGDPSLATVLVWCGPLVVVTGLLVWSEGILQGLRRFRALAGWGAATAVGDLAIAGAAALAGLPALLAARTAVRLASILAAARLFAFRATGEPGGGEAGPAPGRGTIARGLLRFGGLAFLSAALVVLGQNLLRLLLVRGSGLEAAGHFQVADTLGQVLLLVPAAAGVAFLPAVARDHAAGSPMLPASIARAVRRVTGFNLPLCLAAVALGPLAIRLVFGEVYAEAGRALQALACAYALAGISSIAGPVLLGRAEVGQAIVLSLLWVVVLAAGLVAFGAARGAEGAAAALAGAYAVQTTACVVLAARRWRIAGAQTVFPILATLFLPGLALAALRLAPAAAPLTIAATLLAAGIAFARWAWPECAARLAQGGFREAT
jgi:O-antigen/teichoic acid export membrane protein